MHWLSLQLAPGDALLIQGPRHRQTTLLRAFAGLWPYATGSLACPDGAALFCRKNPICLGHFKRSAVLPQRRQRSAAGYPAKAQVQLGHLVARLDEEDDWGWF